MKAKRSAIVQVLQTRFPNQVTASVIETVNKQEDLARLNQWFHEALTAFSMETFQAAMHR
jgi:hypothetical protein